MNNNGRITRRSFIVGGAAVLSTVALGGVGFVLKGRDDLLRPPGAQNEEYLIGACIKCDRCRSACPHNAISVVHVEQGYTNARTPFMNFKQGFCDYCADRGAMRCVESCPTQAIAVGFNPENDKIGLAVVNEDECLLYQSISNHCSTQCITACIYEAVYQGDDGGLYVDRDRCNGCGRCEYSCPSASYGAYSGSASRGIQVKKEA